MREFMTEEKNTFGYQWVRKSTGEFYRGIHTGDPEDNYAGGGTIFIRKYGGKRKTECVNPDDWVRDILFIGTRDECCLWESLVVSERVIKDPKCLNVIVGGQNGIVGYSHTEETKATISKATKGRKLSEETKQKLSDSKKGRVFSEDHKKALSEAAKNRKPPNEESRRKLSEATKAHWARRKEAAMEREVDVEQQ